jgi:glutamine amidotransferase
MIVIVDFGMGNLRSVEKALLRLNAKVKISSDLKVIERAEKLILPGVGNFVKGMEKLRSFHLIDLMNEKVLVQRVPVLGICLGMQLFAKHSEEGNVDGLGWLDAQVVKFHFNKSEEEKKLKIPHMGWNNLQLKRENPFFNQISEEDFFYFVHSYHVVCNDHSDILATTNYGIQFISSLQKNNLIGVQFHPEKSHLSGLQFLKNFIGV